MCDHERNVGGWLVAIGAMTEVEVMLDQALPVIRREDHEGIVAQSKAVELVQQLTDALVVEADLRIVLGNQVVRIAGFGHGAIPQHSDHPLGIKYEVLVDR